MNKIGLQIVRVREGLHKMFTINEGPWMSKVVDARDILKLYEPDEEGRFITFMSFSEGGAYITLVRPIPGRDLDSMAAWMFIPNNIDVDGTEVAELIRVLKKELVKETRDDEYLTDLFSRQYPVTVGAPFVPSSGAREYALRVVGEGYTLQELVGVRRYQPYYAPYNKILLEEPSEMHVIRKDVTDISSRPLEVTAVFCPPAPGTLSPGVEVLIDLDGPKLFKEPVRVLQGEIMNLIFIRDGFNDIPWRVQVENNDQICEVPSLSWTVSVPVNRFRVVAKSKPEKNLTPEARIRVNGETLPGFGAITLSEMEASDAEVTVAVGGYEKFSGHFNLLNGSGVVIPLGRAEREQSFRIELANGHVADMTVRSKSLSRYNQESPLEGYEYDDESGTLRYCSNVITQRAIGFGIACVVALVVWGCMMLYSWYNSHNFSWQLGWPPMKVEAVEADANSASNTESRTDNTA